MELSDCIDRVLEALEQTNLSLFDFLSAVLTLEQYREHPIVLQLQQSCGKAAGEKLIHLLGYKGSCDDPLDLQAAYEATTTTYAHEVCKASSEDSGSHFNVSHTSVTQLEEFSVEEMAKQMEEHAPNLWKLLGMLLDARHVQRCHIDKSGDQIMDAADGNDEDAYWQELGETDLDGPVIGRDGPDASAQRAAKRAAMSQALRALKKIVVMSIFMHGTNRKSNALQSLTGIFLQSAHAPQKVIETLARMGVSVSTNAINFAIRSLSVESLHGIRGLGRTLLASYAYDNFDVDLKSTTHTVEKSGDTLKHLTSGLVFPLMHGISREDLRCSSKLWESSPLNPLQNLSMPTSKNSWEKLLSLRFDSDQLSEAGYTRRERFNSWKFLYDLIHFGPTYFSQFKSRLCDPDEIEMIPVVKTPLFAARAMDLTNSTVSGNIQSIVELLQQGGIENPDECEDPEMPDISEYMVLFHGDLGTSERIQAALQRRAIEDSPWNRLQHVFFIPGLFHLKMACADAIWRTFLQPTTARDDETSLMHDVGILRPRETGIYGSKPGFRRMHQLINYDGICRRLDCWRVEASDRNPLHDTLESFALSQPSFEELQKIADEMARKYVDAKNQLRRMRKQPISHRDQQYENGLLLNKYTLLYEEISYSMNQGDIGRLESCIVAWVAIFKAIGKHKYALQMTEFLCNVHFNLPDGLRRAVRYHMLVNPTGQKGKFRGVDWCVELNNLFTKVINGGKGSNHTVERIIVESPLVQVYRNLHTTIARNFLHTHLTARHAEVDMTKTFHEVCEHLAKHSPHVVQKGRKSKHQITELISKGIELFDKGEWEGVEDAGEKLNGDVVTLEDVAIELDI